MLKRKPSPGHGEKIKARDHGRTALIQGTHSPIDRSRYAPCPPAAPSRVAPVLAGSLAGLLARSAFSLGCRLVRSPRRTACSICSGYTAVFLRSRPTRPLPPRLSDRARSPRLARSRVRDPNRMPIANVVPSMRRAEPVPAEPDAPFLVPAEPNAGAGGQTGRDPRDHRTPARDGNAVRPLISAAEAYPAMERALLGAERTAHLAFRILDPYMRTVSPEAQGAGAEGLGRADRRDRPARASRCGSSSPISTPSSGRTSTGSPGARSITSPRRPAISTRRRGRGSR